MMTPRENFLATIHGEKAERYVNQYEIMELVCDPIMKSIGGFAYTMQPGEKEIDGWGVTVDFPEGVPGPMPVINDSTVVLKDVTEWKEKVKAPNVIRPDEEWEKIRESLAHVNRDEKMVAGFIGPGLFERLHYLMGLEEALIAFYEEPEAMHELIDYLAEYEISYGKELIKNIQPEILFHHDDWGSQISSIMSPDMFEEFILPAYKKIYGFFKENGIIIVHHSDSYAANLVPFMIEMGIDVWQGVMSTNNIPELIEKYGDKITFMGGIDNGKIDRNNWTPELIAAEVEKACRANGTKHYIPCCTMGGPGSIFPGVYEEVSKNIDKMSKELF